MHFEPDQMTAETCRAVTAHSREQAVPSTTVLFNERYVRARGNMRVVAQSIRTTLSSLLDARLISSNVSCKDHNTLRGLQVAMDGDMLAAGPKLRKYASLMPRIRELNPTEVVLIGGNSSNNVLHLLPMLKNEFRVRLAVPAGSVARQHPNQGLIELLAADTPIKYVDRNDWDDAACILQSEFPHGKCRVESGLLVFTERSLHHSGRLSDARCCRWLDHISIGPLVVG